MPKTTLTYTFSANTRIRSAQVNQNFTDNRTHSGFRAYLSSDQNNIADSTYVKILMDAETYDTETWFATGTSLATAPVDGFYFMFGQIRWKSGTLSDQKNILTAFWKNAATNMSWSNVQTSGTTNLHVPHTDVLELNATDTMELRGWHNQGAATPDVESGNEKTYFLMYFLGV